MNENNNENLDSLNKEVEELENKNVEDLSDEEKVEHYDKLKSLNKQLYVRVKKAEGFELKDGKWVKNQPEVKKEEQIKSNNNLSHFDLIAIMKADIPEEDVEVVLKYAEFNKTSVRDALNDSILKSILSTKAEERRTASATHTGKSNIGTAKISDEKLLEDARKGILPKNEEDLKRLATLSLKRR